MRAKLIVEGKEFDIDIFDPELEKLVKPEKKTGYERVERDEDFYCQTSAGNDVTESPEDAFTSNYYYDSANYYSSEEIAKNNVRADKLMRQLRRFAALQRDENLDWHNNKYKYCIYYDYTNRTFKLDYTDYWRVAFGVYFNSEACAKHAIETFHDELIWYFTEYKDSL